MKKSFNIIRKKLLDEINSYHVSQDVLENEDELTEENIEKMIKEIDKYKTI